MTNCDTSNDGGDTKTSILTAFSTDEGVSDAPDMIVVGIGASAGGLDALERFLAHMPADAGFAFVVVQHLAPDHVSRLAELLGRRTTMPVIAAVEGLHLHANHVYVNQPGTRLRIAHNTLHAIPLEAEPEGQIDALLRSLAEDQGKSAVGIILSGTGRDGTNGLRSIKEHGGMTLAQAPADATYGDMPQSAIDAQVVDHVAEVDRLPAKLLERAQWLAQQDDSGVVAAPWTGEISDEDILGALDKICQRLRQSTGHDFSLYKRGTLIRRIRHRLQREHILDFPKYLSDLETDAREAELLGRDLLVGVTQFFRDPEAFDYLGLFVISQIIASASSQEGVRIWVPGCATGEEAYTIGILVRERLATVHPAPHVQIFATDIDPDAIAEARVGRYSAAIAQHVSPERLARFFTQDGQFYQVSKEVREMCVFSEHSLVRDPPFLGLDLISCRNVLIYLQQGLQKKLVPVFHYALRPGGYLLLGPSEGLGGHHELFHTVDKRYRIFQRADVVRRPFIEWPVSTHSFPRTSKQLQRESAAQPLAALGVNAAFERLMLQEYVPPAVVVTEGGDILCVAGLTGAYLQPPAGVLSTNILEVVHVSLRIELRTALHTAARSASRVVRENVPVEVGGVMRRLRLTVRPMPHVKHEGLFVVVLQEREAEVEAPETEASLTVHESVIEQLEGELRTTRANLRTTIEELEAANEELKASNEELLSTNEEMQSSNEELQSSQEELRSVNEELATVNAELGRRVDELGRTNSDLQTLFSSTDVATLFLDCELRVTKFTPAAKMLFKLIEADAGRPLADLAPRFQDCDLLADVTGVLKSLQKIERQLQTIDGQGWYLLRIFPYRTLEGRVIGAVITLVDITKSKHLEVDRERLVVELRDTQMQLQAALDATTRLLKVGSLFMRGGNLSLVLDDILDAAIAVTHADFGNIQLVDRATGDLRITAQRGFSRDWVDYWNNFNATRKHSTCAAALETRERVIVEDVETSPMFMGDRSLDVQLEAGVRAVQSTPLLGRGGEPLGIISTHYKVRGKPSDRALHLLDVIARQAADILERAAAEEAVRGSERRFRALVDATMEAPFRMNADWTELRELTGRGFLADRAEPTRDWVGLYIPGEDRARVLGVIRDAIQTKSVFQLEHRVVRSDGEVGWALTRAAPMLGDRGEIIEWFGTVGDVTSRKRSEIEIEQANDRLREADRRKNDFLGMLSHELRNPLAAITTSLYLLDHAPPNSDSYRRAADVIHRQTEQLTRLVDDLLDITRLTRGKIRLQLQRLDLNEVVIRAVEDYQAVFEKAGIALEICPNVLPVWVDGDRTRLAQVIGNLLSNAVKFNPRGGSTSVLVSSTNSHALVTIRDTGAGIAPDMLSRIFEPFTQGDSTLDRSLGGLGLGLAVLKGLVELHGGTVRAESEGLGKGASFYISLPIAAAPKLLVAAQSGPHAVNRHRVVLIEDNVDAADTLREVIAMAGHDVDVAYSGSIGIDLVRHFDADVVICDIGLPGLDGYEVARALRENPKTRSIYLIALSGYGGQEDVAKAREAGFDAHLVKPANIEVLNRLLERIGSS